MGNVNTWEGRKGMKGGRMGKRKRRGGRREGRRKEVEKIRGGEQGKKGNSVRQEEWRR